MSNYYDIIKQLCRTPAVDENAPDFNSTTLANIEYKQYINQAYRLICADVRLRTFKKSTIINTVADQQEYDRPSGIITNVFYGTNKLEYINDLSELDASTGTPKGYYVSGDKVGIYRTPNDVYPVKLNYLSNLIVKAADNTLKSSLVLETDTPLINEDYHDLIVMGAELIYMRDKAKKNSPKAQSDYNYRFNQFIDYDRGTLEASPIIKFA